MTLSDFSGLSSPLSSVPSTPELEIPSSPLSSLSRSPSPPPSFRLFTPPPSQDAGEDMPRPRKRRKLDRTDRTTRYLDLTEDAAQAVYDRSEAIDVLVHALRKRRKIVVIAGAGISVSAGIPDFRSSDGLFAGLQKEHKLKGGTGKQLFDASVYKDATLTSQFHEMVRKLAKMSKRAKPTAFHNMIARLSKEDRLLRLYTQNIDELETQIPPLATEVPLPHKGPWPQTIQLHGGLEKMTCQKCREILKFDPILFDGEETPTCPKCRETDDFRTIDLGRRSHGIGRLRPRIVLYNEQNPDEEAIGAVSAADMKTRPDAVVVVGTSMKIPGVRRIVSEMCKIVRDRKEGTTIWINPDPEPTGPLFENSWDLIVKGSSDQVANLVKLKHWEDEKIDDSEMPTEYTDSDVERINARQGEIRVNVPASPLKKLITPVAVMTPPRSQHGDSQPDRRTKPKSQTSPQTPPLRIKLNVGEKSVSAEAENKKKQQIVPRVDVPPLAKLKNPASGGRKLLEVLGKDNVEKNRKPKTSLKKKAKSKNADGSIQQAKLDVKVTKPSAVQLAAKAVLPAKKAGPSLFGDRAVSQPSSDYRNWTQTSSPNRAPTMGAGLSSFGVFQSRPPTKSQIPTPALTSDETTPQDTPDPQTPPAIGSPTLYDRKHTVSPPSKPRGLEAMID